MSGTSNEDQDYSQSQSCANPKIDHYDDTTSLQQHLDLPISQLVTHGEKKDPDLTGSLQDENTRRKRLLGIVREIERDGCVNAICFNLDGKIAIGGEDNKVIIYDTASGGDTKEINQDSPVFAVAFSSNGEQIAVGAGNRAIIYESTTGAVVTEIQRNDLVRAVAFSHDGSKICVGGWDKKTVIHDVISGTILREIYRDRAIIAITFSPNDSQILVLGGDDSKAVIYDVITGAILRKIERSGSVTAVAFSPDGSRIAICDGIGGKDGVVIYDAATGAILNEIKHGPVYSVAFSPNGRQIAVGGVSEQSEAIIYDAMSGAILKEIHRDGPVLAIAFSPDGKYIAVGGTDNKAVIYDDVGSTAILHEFVHELAIWAIAFSTDSSLFALACNKKAVIYRYDGISAVVLNQFESSGIVYSIAFSLDSSKLLIGGAENKLIIYDVKSANIDKEIECDGCINSIAISEDGTQIAIGSDKALICDATGAIIHEFESDASVIKIAFSPSGNHVACGYDNNTTIYDVVTGSVVQEFEDKELITTIAYSSNGSHIAVGPIIYDTRTAAIVKKLDYIYHVSTISFSSNGRYLGIGGSEKIMHIYDTTNWELFCSPILFHEPIESICFLSSGGHSNFDSKSCILAIAFGKFATIMRVSKHTKTPVGILVKCEPDQVLNQVKLRTTEATLWQNENGETLLSVAAKEDRLDLLSGLLTHCMKYVFIPNDFMGKSNGVLAYLQGRRDLQTLHKVFDAKFYSASSSAVQLVEMVMVLNKLARNQDSISVVKALNAGGEMAVPGFVLQHDDYLLDPQDEQRSGLWCFLDILPNINTCSRKLFSSLLSKASPSQTDLTIWRRYGTDPDKRVHYKTLRVLLPDLGGFEPLKALIKMQSIEPFNVASLCTVINAHWSKWARKKFLFQFFIFMVWIICLTWACVMNDKESTIIMSIHDQILSILVLVGVLYFATVLSLQASTCCRKRYWTDGWNVRQAVSLILALVSIILKHARISHAIVAHVNTVTLLFNWVGLLFYLRVFESDTWVIHVLVKIGKAMIPFLRVWSIVVFIFALSFYPLQDTIGTGNSCRSDSLGKSLAVNFFAKIGGSESIMAESHFNPFELLLIMMILISTLIIPLHVLIAFVGHEFGIVVENQSAVLAREKARIILEMYCLMTNNQRRRIEKDNKWTYVIVPMTTLDIIVNEHAAVTNLSNSKATQDSILEMKAEMMVMFKQELNAIKELQEMKTELKDELNEAVTTLKDDMKTGLSKTMELNEGIVLQLGTIEAMLTDKYDEVTISDMDEKSILSEDYRTITITKKDSEPFYECA